MSSLMLHHHIIRIKNIMVIFSEFIINIPRYVTFYNHIDELGIQKVYRTTLISSSQIIGLVVAKLYNNSCNTIVLCMVRMSVTQISPSIVTSVIILDIVRYYTLLL